MTRVSRFTSGVLATWCCLAAAPVRAAIIQWSYSGVVGYGYDHAGIFGSATDLTGRPFTMVERFNTVHNAFRYADDAQSLQFGGTQRGAAGSASITVTIGGVGRSIADREDYIYSGSVTGKHLDFVKDSTGYEYAGFYVESPFLVADYAKPLSIGATQGNFIGNYQFFSRTDPALATFASFDVAHLTVSSPSGVPIPDGMALFGSGLLLFAAAGYTHRRGQRAAATNLDQAQPFASALRQSRPGLET